MHFSVFEFINAVERKFLDGLFEFAVNVTKSALRATTAKLRPQRVPLSRATAAATTRRRRRRIQSHQLRGHGEATGHGLGGIHHVPRRLSGPARSPARRSPAPKCHAPTNTPNAAASSTATAQQRSHDQSGTSPRRRRSYQATATTAATAATTTSSVEKRHPDVGRRHRQEHSGFHGDRSVRHDRLVDIHQGGGDRSEPRVIGLGHGSHHARIEPQQRGQPLPNVRGSVGGNAVSTAGHRLPCAA